MFPVGLLFISQQYRYCTKSSFESYHSRMRNLVTPNVGCGVNSMFSTTFVSFVYGSTPKFRSGGDAIQELYFKIKLVYLYDVTMNSTVTRLIVQAAVAFLLQALSSPEYPPPLTFHQCPQNLSVQTDDEMSLYILVQIHRSVC